MIANFPSLKVGDKVKCSSTRLIYEYPAEITEIHEMTERYDVFISFRLSGEDKKQIGLESGTIRISIHK